LIQYVVFWLNNIPKEGQTQSPRKVIMGECVLDYNIVCKLPFGACVQVHEDNSITNTMDTRTTGGISLGPSNLNGGFKFFSLVTGEILTRRKWTKLLVPSELIQSIEEMSGDDGEIFVYSLLGNEEIVPDKDGIYEVQDNSHNVDDKIDDDVINEDNPELMDEIDRNIM
jgi:hypothetical protein